MVGRACWSAIPWSIGSWAVTWFICINNDRVNTQEKLFAINKSKIEFEKNTFEIEFEKMHLKLSYNATASTALIKYTLY